MKLLLSFLNSHKVCSFGNWYSVCSVIPDTGIRIDGIVPKECALKETEIGTALYETSTLSLSWKIRNIGTTRNTMFSQISQSHKQYFARSPNGFGQWQRVASLFFGFFSAAISPKEIYILPRLSVHGTTMQVNTGNGWDKFQSCWPKIPKWQTFREKKKIAPLFGLLFRTLDVLIIMKFSCSWWGLFHWKCWQFHEGSQVDELIFCVCGNSHVFFVHSSETWLYTTVHTFFLVMDSFV